MPAKRRIRAGFVPEFAPMMRRTRSLGLLVDSLVDDYPSAVLAGAADAAREHGWDLLCFAGGRLRSPVGYEVERNALYDLVGPENVEGLVVVSGLVGNYLSGPELTEFCARFGALPWCSVSRPVTGSRADLLVDNAAGMRAALDHLIDVHGARRIAFIRGPDLNAEAEGRYRVYCTVLAERQLALCPELVVRGDFTAAGGARATAELLDVAGAPPHAIVAANDYMALGAMQALAERRMRVPDEVAVVGFDDVEEARVARPPLTTVRQPMYELGRRSIAALLRCMQASDRAHSADSAASEPLQTQLVIRRSCGCRSQHTDTRAFLDVNLGDAFGTELAARKEVVTRRMAEATGGELDNALLERLVDAFAADLRAATREGTLGVLQHALAARGGALRDASLWQDLISAMRNAVAGLLVAQPELRLLAEDIWQEARAMIAHEVERRELEHRLNVQRWAATLSETSAGLITTFDSAALLRAVTEQLPRLGIDSCFVALYEDAARERVRLVVSYDARAPQQSPVDGSDYPSRHILPSALWPQRITNWVVEPLYFKDEQLGFVVFELGPRDGLIYEALRDQISGALKGERLVRQVVAHDRERQRLIGDLQQRASELQAAYVALQRNQQQLITAERLAALGRITANLAHEMATPLAAIRAALVNLEQLVGEYRQSAGDPSVTRADHAEIATEMLRETRLMASAAERAAQYVRGIKTQTREPAASERVHFDAIGCVEEALLLLGHLLRKSDCRVEVNAEPGPLLLIGSPARLAQVVTNLVTNAVDACSGRTGAQVQVELARTVGAIVLRVTDTGRGIAADDLAHIFEPAFTTKPFGQGTGLGLTIVKDIVTADFGGTVFVNSELGRGSTFEVHLPTGAG